MAAIFLSTSSAAEDQTISVDATEQVIWRLFYQPTTDAVEAYYGERRQYWRTEVLDVQKVPDSPYYYKTIIQVETFSGAHNPPYGLETMTFHIGPLDQVQLVHFEHLDESG